MYNIHYYTYFNIKILREREREALQDCWAKFWTGSNVLVATGTGHSSYVAPGHSLN